MNLDLKWPIELAQRFAIVKSIKPVRQGADADDGFILATLQRSCQARWAQGKSNRRLESHLEWVEVVVGVGVGVGVGIGVKGKCKANRSVRSCHVRGIGLAAGKVPLQKAEDLCFGAPSSVIVIGHRASGIVIDISIDISTAQRWRTFTRTNSVNFYCDFLEPKTRATTTTTKTTTIQAESACPETR